MKTPLEKLLLRMISATGPISIAQYMHLCHSHPEHGLYATGNPIGREGDFITAPEISQMFGELIAIWAISLWKQMGCPSPFQIAELGPGRGTLAKDFRRSAKTNSDFENSITYCLIETSPELITQQKQTLKDENIPFQWVEEIETLYPIPTLFIANEFFDALPFRQFIKSENIWLEHCIGVNREDKLALVLGEASLDEATLPAGHEQEPDGTIFEIAPAREALMEQIARHIQSHNGAALIIDYGHDRSGFGDTFQAVKAHNKISPLATPGQCDLTSHVDFGALAGCAKINKTIVHPIITQSEFLLEIGLLQRAGTLGRGKSKLQQSQIEADVERLAGPDEMGKLFKVMCIANSKNHIHPFYN